MGGLAFYGSLTKSIEGDFISYLFSLYSQKQQVHYLDIWMLTWAYSFLQSLALTIRLVPTIWTINDTRNYSKQNFWNDVAPLVFTIGMWFLLGTTFFNIFIPSFEFIIQDIAKGDVDIIGVLNGLAIGFIRILSFYMIFWCGYRLYPKKIYILPLLVSIFYVVMLITFF